MIYFNDICIAFGDFRRITLTHIRYLKYCTWFYIQMRAQHSLLNRLKLHTSVNGEQNRKFFLIFFNIFAHGRGKTTTLFRIKNLNELWIAFYVHICDSLFSPFHIRLGFSKITIEWARLNDQSRVDTTIQKWFFFWLLSKAICTQCFSCRLPQ